MAQSFDTLISATPVLMSSLPTEGITSLSSSNGTQVDQLNNLVSPLEMARGKDSPNSLTAVALLKSQHL